MALEHVFSDGGLLNCGAPYGSFLGPFIFVIYMNDLPYALKETELYLYSDVNFIFYRKSHEQNIFVTLLIIHRK